MSAPSRLAVCALALVLVAASPVWAGPPTDALRTHIDRIFALLDDPAMKSVSLTAARHARLRVLAEEAVDFPEAAQRALGPAWNDRTPTERAHFVRLFTDLIDHGYLWRMSHDDERFVFEDEAVSGKDAVVRTRAVTASKGSGTPVAF